MWRKLTKRMEVAGWLSGEYQGFRLLLGGMRAIFEDEMQIIVDRPALRAVRLLPFLACFRLGPVIEEALPVFPPLLLIVGGAGDPAAVEGGAGER